MFKLKKSVYICQTKQLLIKNKKVKDNTSKKKFNRNSITVNVDSKYSVNASNKFVYDAKQTELIHDTLQVLLNSPNPLRKEYGFNDFDFEFIAQYVKKQNALLSELSYFLQKCKEHEQEKYNY